MAGIKGQPTPTPSDLQSPVPTTASSFDEFQAQAPSFEEFQAQGPGPEQMAEEPASFESPWYTAALPAVGAVAGGIAGSGGAGVGAIPGAALGGAAGQSLRELIEVNILGRPEGSLKDSLTGVATEGIKEGTGQALGMGIVKGAGKVAGKVASSKAGQWAGEKMAEIASAPMNYVKQTINGVRESIEAPLLQVIANKTSPANVEQAGDAVKTLFQQDIGQRFGKFQVANKTLNNVAKAIPLADEPRAQFYDKSYEWAQNTLGMDNQKLVGRWLNKLIESNSLAQFESVKKEMGRAALEAAQTYGEKSSQTMALKEIQGRAGDFVEDQVSGLAKRIAKGTASMPEMNAFQQMMGVQQNPTVAVNSKNLMAYTKSVAQDYLDGKAATQKYYSQFRGFLEDVGEQVRISPSGKGVKNFVESIQDVPSEKLVERMWDPKNAAALRRMQTETPMIFENVAKARMNQVLQQASPDGVLDLANVRKILYKMPEPTRNLLMSGDEMKTLNQVLNNPRLKRLGDLESMGEEFVGKWARRVFEVSNIAAEAAPKAANTVVGRQMIGKAAQPFISPLANVMGGAPVPPQE